MPVFWGVFPVFSAKCQSFSSYIKILGQFWSSFHMGWDPSCISIELLCFSVQFVEDTIFTPMCILIYFWKSMGLYICGLNSAFSLLSHQSLYLFVVPITYFFLLLWLCSIAEMRIIWLSKQSFVFLYEFRDFFLHLYIKNIIGILRRIASNRQNTFSNTAIFTWLILLSNAYERTFHLLMSFFFVNFLTDIFHFLSKVHFRNFQSRCEWDCFLGFSIKHVRYWNRTRDLNSVHWFWILPLC